MDPPLFDVVETDPVLRRYWEHFGSQPGDMAVAGQITEGVIGGIAWARILGGDHPGYGYLDDQTPEIAVAVQPGQRNQGLGKALLIALCDGLHDADYTQASLSVDKDNPARHLYERLGFTVAKENNTDLIMVKQL